MRVYRHQPRSTDYADPRPISFSTYSRNRRFVRRDVFIAPFSSSSFSLSRPVERTDHDISTMETARARLLLSHSTSFRTRLSKSALSTNPHLVLLPSLSLLVVVDVSSRCTLNILYPSSVRASIYFHCANSGHKVMSK